MDQLVCSLGVLCLVPALRNVRLPKDFKGPRKVLGNVVISKKFLRTRKIMVMHSNERGECCLCTLVDRSRKLYINVVDVVVRLHDPTDPSTESTAPPSSAHVQLDDVLAFSIQQDGPSSR